MTAPVASVVVLDLDDTLYLERDYVRSGFKAVEQWLVLERAAAGFSDTCWRLFEGGHRGDIFDQGLLELGLDSHAELVAQLVTVYREHHPRSEENTSELQSLMRISYAVFCLK